MLHVGKVYGIYGTSFEKIVVGCSINASILSLKLLQEYRQVTARNPCRGDFLTVAWNHPPFVKIPQATKAQSAGTKKTYLKVGSY